MRIEVVRRRVQDQWSFAYLEEAARRLGHDVESVADGGFSGDVVLLVGSPTWYPATVRRLVALAPAARPRVVVFQTEPLALPRAAPFPHPLPSARELAKIVLRDPRRSDTRSNLRALVRLHRHGLPQVLGVATAAWRETLAEAGIAAELIPLGWSPASGELLSLERDIDVLFLGETRLRHRRRVLRRLRRDGLDVLAVGSWTDPAFWGDSRTRLLNRVKILLNVARAPGQYGLARFVLGAANGALVVSEPVYAPEPLVPGVHFVEAPLDDLADTCRRWLADDAAREAMVARAHAFAVRELTWEHSLERLLAPLR